MDFGGVSHFIFISMYVVPFFQKDILMTLQVQVRLGLRVCWFHGKAVKTKDKNLINSSNNI